MLKIFLCYFMLSKSFKYIYIALFILVCSCVKSVQPSEVEGKWRSIYEVWQINTDGTIKTESFDYGDKPTVESAKLDLFNTGFDLFAESPNKTLDLVYSDRYSPLKENSDQRLPIEMTVRIRKRTITGSGDATWVICSLKKGRMELDYDSGTLMIDDAEVHRRCRFVFIKNDVI